MTCSQGPIPQTLVTEHTSSGRRDRNRSASLTESAVRDLMGRRPSAAERIYMISNMGNSVSSDKSVDKSFPEDLSKRPFQEFFFHAVPLVVHPIIILRVLCHRMFGNMLRRKTRYSAHNLSPPLVMESDTCPPRSPSTDGDINQREDDEYDRRKSGKKKGNLHVSITTPTDVEETEEMIRQRRRRTRAGSMDKHLMGSTRKPGNRTMSLAIKAIGESLVTPLDLNLSPPPRTSETDHDSNPTRSMSVRKNIFRFPSIKTKKRISKSHGYLAALGQSLDEESLKSSAASLHCEEKDIRDFQRELINLPTFEVDTHRMDQCTSPLLSRSNSVPEHLGAMLVPQFDKSPSVCQISVTGANEGSLQNQMVLGIPADDKRYHHPMNLSLPMNDDDDFPARENIVVKFAAATPIESPASNIDEPISPLSCSKTDTESLEQQLSQISLPHSEHGPMSPVSDGNHLTVSTTASSVFLAGPPIPVSPSTGSFYSELTCRSLNMFSATPSMDIPAHHAGVMAAMEVWIDVCPLDLEATPMMKHEMKDFLHKMAGLGMEYKIWSVKISEKLKLEVSITSYLYTDPHIKVPHEQSSFYQSNLWASCHIIYKSDIVYKC